MTLLAIPNVSEGRDRNCVSALVRAAASSGAAVVDVHADPTHNRSVLTTVGDRDVLTAGMTSLARACHDIDLTRHMGVHPRLGALDVCPVVPHDEPMPGAVSCALEIADAIGDEVGLPVYLYGAAAARPETRSLSLLRRGGLSGLMRSAEQGLVPDRGPARIDPRHGVVCVGARDVLIAFNVWLRCPVEQAAEIASKVRESGGGLPGVRALGLAIDAGTSQVSMNLARPEVTGIDPAYDAVAALAAGRGIEIIATEVVGVPPQKFLPDPRREAARLLIQPGRSLESVLPR